MSFFRLRIISRDSIAKHLLKSFQKNILTLFKMIVSLIGIWSLLTQIGSHDTLQ